MDALKVDLTGDQNMHEQPRSSPDHSHSYIKRKLTSRSAPRSFCIVWNQDNGGEGKLKSPKRLSVRFSSVAQSCPTLCNPMNCSTPAFPIHHQLLELTQTHVNRVGDAIQPSHPLSSPSPPADFSLSQHQGLFKWVSSSHQVAKVLEFQPQHQSFQWTCRDDLL